MTTIITQVRNAQSRGLLNNEFDVEIEHPDHGWMPYTVGENFYSSSIDNRSVLDLIGTDFLAYIPPTQDELDAELAASLRAQRDQKLVNEVDPIVTNPLRWAELTDTKQAEWTQYRTDLLNLPEQSGFPSSVTWPTKPT